jgi:DNA-directed RNA polymerase subunit M
MLFCPSCKALCTNDYKIKQAQCTRCGTLLDLETPAEIRNKKLSDGKIVILSNSLKKIRSLPIKRCLCPKCGNKEAYVSMVGSRSEEDYETERYRCTDCNHSWRETS